MNSRMRASRRAALGVLVLAAGVTVTLREWPALLHRHRFTRTGPNEDLLARLGDRDSSARLGRAVHVHPPDRAELEEIREVLKSQTLARLSQKELASGMTAEIGGWVLPLTFARLCALAARE